MTNIQPAIVLCMTKYTYIQTTKAGILCNEHQCRLFT